MPRKELEALNGPAFNVDPRKPMTWEEFKALPSSSQEYYVTYLVKHYHVGKSDICRMFKIAINTLTLHIKNHPGIQVYNRKGKPSPEDRKLLDKFYKEYGIGDAFSGGMPRGSYGKAAKKKERIAKANAILNEEREKAERQAQITAAEKVSEAFNAAFEEAKKTAPSFEGGDMEVVNIGDTVNIPAPDGFKEYFDSVQNAPSTECNLSSFNIVFNGPVDLQAVMDALSGIVDGVDGRLAIRFDRKENA